MKMNSKNLITQIRQAFNTRPHEFPREGSFNYPKALDGWMSHLEANVFPAVTAGGIAIDGGHLTLHDAEHVRKVSRVACDLLVGMGKGTPSSYEMILLLVAINLHDIGNVLGRAGHESKIAEVLAIVGTPTGFDNVETRLAMDIARVHGGETLGSKDTISTLPDVSTVYGLDIRPRFLASILRLADELADDPARANKVQSEAGKLPHTSEIFHQYAKHTHTLKAKPNDRTIEMKLDFSDPSLFMSKLGKGKEEEYLIEEIFIRALKCYREARYCSRFMRPHMDFDKVSVEVAIFDKLGPQLERIKFTLAERGYADEAATIYQLAPELNMFHDRGPLTGEILAQCLQPQGIQGST